MRPIALIVRLGRRDGRHTQIEEGDRRVALFFALVRRSLWTELRPLDLGDADALVRRLGRVSGAGAARGRDRAVI